MSEPIPTSTVTRKSSAGTETREHTERTGPLWPIVCPPQRHSPSLLTPEVAQFPPSQVLSQERGCRGPTCQPAVRSSITAGALTFRAWHQDDRFRCNVPQIALTFGKYSTSGPIQFQTFFWKRREMAERAARACNVLKRNCSPAHTPAAEPSGLSASPPRNQGALAALLPLPQDRGLGGGMDSSEQVPEHTASLHRGSAGSPSIKQAIATCLLDHLLSARPYFTHVVYMSSFAIITTL